MSSSREAGGAPRVCRARQQEQQQVVCGGGVEVVEQQSRAEQGAPERERAAGAHHSDAPRCVKPKRPRSTVDHWPVAGRPLATRAVCSAAITGKTTVVKT